MSTPLTLSTFTIKAQIEHDARRIHVPGSTLWATAEHRPLECMAFVFLKSELPGYRQAAGELWKHSLACASIAHLLGQELRIQGCEQAYLAGLLHDIGKPLLDPYIADEYPQLVEGMWKRKLQLWQIEQQLFGTHHAAVGALVVENLGLPANLVEAVRCHHHPTGDCAAPELTALVHIANTLTPLDGWGLAALGGRTIHPEALRILGLNLPALGRLRKKIASE